jgi:hypothetical protein
MNKTLAVGIALTGTAIGPAISCNESPFLGGAGRNAIVYLDAAPGGAAVVKIQGHPGLASKAAPASGDAGWADIVQFIAGDPLGKEIALPLWIRYNITTLGTGTLNARLRGVQ